MNKAETSLQHSNQDGHQPTNIDTDICVAIQILLEATQTDSRVKSSVLTERFSLTKSIQLIKKLEQRGIISAADASFTRTINTTAAQVLLDAAASTESTAAVTRLLIQPLNQNYSAATEIGACQNPFPLPPFKNEQVG